MKITYLFTPWIYFYVVVVDIQIYIITSMILDISFNGESL